MFYVYLHVESSLVCGRIDDLIDYSARTYIDKGVGRV
jgi:hypothetical protein